MATEQSAAPRRSARLRKSRDARRRTRPSRTAAVALCLSEIGRCFAENLVRPPQLPILALQRLESLALLTSEPRTPSGVALHPSDPLAQGLRGAAYLPRKRRDRGPLGRVRTLVLPHQPHGSLPNLRRELRSGHSPNLSQLGVSGKPGSVQIGARSGRNPLSLSQCCTYVPRLFLASDMTLTCVAPHP